MNKFNTFIGSYSPELAWERVSVIQNLFNELRFSDYDNNIIRIYEEEVNREIIKNIQPKLLNTKTNKFYYADDEHSTLEYIEHALSRIETFHIDVKIPYIQQFIGSKFEKDIVNHSNDFGPSCEGAFTAQVTNLNILSSKLTAYYLIRYLTGVATKSGDDVMDFLFNEKQKVLSKILFYGNLLGGEFQKQSMEIATKSLMGGVKDNRPVFHVMGDLSNDGKSPGSYFSSDCEKFYSDIAEKVNTFFKD